MFFKIIQREILRNSSLRWCAPLVRAHIINTTTSIQNGTTAAQISDWMCLQRATCFITKNVVYCLVKRKICSVVRKTRYKYSLTKPIDIWKSFELTAYIEWQVGEVHQIWCSIDGTMMKAFCGNISSCCFLCGRSFKSVCFPKKSKCVVRSCLLWQFRIWNYLQYTDGRSVAYCTFERTVFHQNMRAKKTENVKNYFYLL